MVENLTIVSLDTEFIVIDEGMTPTNIPIAEENFLPKIKNIYNKVSNKENVILRIKTIRNNVLDYCYCSSYSIQNIYNDRPTICMFLNYFNWIVIISVRLINNNLQAFLPNTLFYFGQ